MKNIEEFKKEILSKKFNEEIYAFINILKNEIEETIYDTLKFNINTKFISASYCSSKILQSAGIDFPMISDNFKNLYQPLIIENLTNELENSEYTLLSIEFDSCSDNIRIELALLKMTIKEKQLFIKNEKIYGKNLRFTTIDDYVLIIAIILTAFGLLTFAVNKSYMCAIIIIAIFVICYLIIHLKILKNKKTLMNILNIKE